MKKATFCLAFTFFSFLSIAQVQRVVTPKPVDSGSATKENLTDNKKVDRKQMFRELNLSKEQRSKLKEIRQSNTAKRDAISNNDSLTQDQKDARLRELKREQAKSIMPVLNDEQKAKVKSMRGKRQQNEN